MINLNMDAYLLLSIINTKLRDIYHNLDDLCEDLNIDKNKLSQQLKNINYIYNEEHNAFIVKK